MRRSVLAGAVGASMGLAFCVLGSGFAAAAPVTFFGEDVNTSGDPNEAPFTNATNASNSFFANLTGVGTETFESFATGTSAPLPIGFMGAGTATINDGTIASGNDGAGRYPFSGTQYLNVGSDNFSISFSNPIAALGFYGIDIGDFGGQLTLTLTDINNVTSTLTVPNTIGNNGSTSGSNLYFGFFDTGDTYTSVSFGNNSGGADVFAFDNFSIGSTAQVTPSTPEASTWVMMLAGFAGMGFIAYRKRGTKKILSAA
jgi:hypothetical protein